MAKPRSLVSVLVPTYNGEKFLDETLLSIRRQAYRNLEILIRDDGSTDATIEIARQNAREDSRITVIESEENGGGRKNYIALAELATGDYIKFCNQDDLLDPACVQTLVAAFETNPSVTLATSTRTLIDDAGRPLPPTGFTQPLVDRDAVLDGRQTMRHVMLKSVNQIGEPTTTLYRNRMVEPDQMFCFGGRQARLNGDVALWMNLLKQGDLAFHLKPLSSFRIHGDQISATTRTRVYGRVEWAYLLEIGLNEGIVTHEEFLQHVGPTLGSLLNAAAEAASTRDPKVDGSIEEIADLAARLFRLIGSHPA